MAELILSPIVKVVIETLCSAIVENLGSLWGVKDDLSDLKESLSRIQAVLLDAEEKQSRSHQVRHWLQRLEEVVDEADDLFDEVATEGLRRKLAPTTTWKKIRTSHARLKFRYKMTKEIKSVKKKMGKIVADKKDFQLESRDEIVRPVGRGRETRSFVDEEQVVGRVGDKSEVLELMMSPESRVGQKRVSVIPIVGMGGLGKTTLAQFIFNDVKVKDNFEPRIWVCVSDDFDERTIVGKIVESITGKCTRDATLENLQKTLRERITGKRYFLVLDDVWSEEWKKWQNVNELLLNCGEPGSTIVVTTRSDIVAKLSSEVQPYHLGILDEDESWSLFEKIAFKKGKEPSEVALEIGNKIVQKCGGIPLAIRMIAGMLSELEPETKWSSFLDKELSSITQKDGDIMPTLRLSYDFLQSNLKHCFAYCSLFPKDYKFDVETLVTLWMAQGFISVPSDGSQSLEDVGYDYFLELVWRSFFQELEIDEVMDKILRCKMHDLVHDLAIQVGGEKYARLDHGSKPNALEKALHVSLGWRESMPSSLLHAKKLRSLIRPWTSGYGKSEVRGEMTLDFSLLRMLDLHRSQINEELNSIGELKHLRYLDLSWNYSITRLPTSITKLVNLQTLKLTDCRYLCELPTDIGKLVNLRHLTWSNEELYLPRGVSQLTNLRTLSYFTLSEDPTHITLDELLGLDNLGGWVNIREIRNGMKVNDGILKDKKLVRSLQLSWSDPHIHGANQEVEMTLEGLQPSQNLRVLTVNGYSGIKFSDWFSSLRNLVELRLDSCFKLKKLSSLESLCSLRKIHVSYCYDLEYIVMDSNGDGALEAPIPVFPSLQHMVLRELNKFKGWTCSNITENKDDGVQLLSYFPCLTSLHVISCPELISMPLYPNVKKLHLIDTNQMSFEQTVTTYLARPQISQASATTCSSSPSPSSTPRFYPLIELRNLCLCCRNLTDVQYFPDWMQSFSCLETLEISESKSFSLVYDRMSWINKEGDEHQMSTRGNRTSWEIFSGVRKLILRGVQILKHVSLAAQYFTSLENLVIEGESEDLDFSWEGLPIVHKEIFSRLKSLDISLCDNLSGIPNWIFKLSSLQRLDIIKCKKLESMPASLSSLTSLQSLTIHRCPILILDDEIEWDALVSLHSLSLRKLPKLVTLPSELQHATTLQALHLNDCENLSALPDWIGNLSSLQRLRIAHCSKIESLPGSIKSLTSLQTLGIFGCPSLTERCRRDTGKDWPNICHINTIYISGI